MESKECTVVMVLGGNWHGCPWYLCEREICFLCNDFNSLINCVQWFILITITTSKFWSEGRNNIYIISSPPHSTYMRQWTGSALVQLLAWHLLCTQPTTEPMLVYCELDRPLGRNLSEMLTCECRKMHFENACELVAILTRGGVKLQKYLIESIQVL